ncbi:MAG: hypothetical protein Q8N34_03285 [Gammaproteobacteria bacterium]|nr:hypothetical protein [Gammaproteobacteria bacterium]
MPVEIVQSLIGALAVIVVAIIGYLSKRNTELKLANTRKELLFQHDALSLRIEAHAWHQINLELIALAKNTCIDRFIIFCGWNGSDEPRWTTAVYQYRHGDQSHVAYVHVETDYDYVQRLTKAKVAGELVFRTDDIQNSLIKQIYMAEEIKSAAWFHLDSRALSGTKSRAVRYCSFATHQNVDLDNATLMHCRRIVSMIKGAMQ